MKQQLKTGLILSLFMLLTIAGTAQNRSAAETTSAMGFWVAESNLSSPMDHVLRFYTNNNELVYTETLNGVKLKLAKKKIRVKLKEVLESSILAWQKNKAAESNKNYFAVKLKE